MTDITDELRFHSQHAEAPAKVLHLLAEAASTIERYRVWLAEANKTNRLSDPSTVRLPGHDETMANLDALTISPQGRSPDAGAK